MGAFKPDIVSVQCPARQSLPVIGAHVLPHTWRLVVTARAESEIRAEGTDDRWLQAWLRRLFRRADAVTAVSDALARDLIALYPFLRDRCRAIHNGIDPSWLTEPAGPEGPARQRYVLYVGRLDPSKGIDILLEAWRQVRARAPGIPLYVAGAGPETDRWRALAQHLGVAPDVRFMGRVDQGELPALYRGADLVVVPSRRRSEGLPRVLLEAGASGAVAVATRVGGAPEVIEDSLTGFLVEPDSPDALAAALLRGLGLSAAERRAMATAAARRIATWFSHDHTVAAYEELFRSLLAPAPVAHGCATGRS